MGWRNTGGYTNRTARQLLPRRLARITTTAFVCTAAAFQKGLEEKKKTLIQKSKAWRHHEKRENTKMTFHIAGSCENMKEAPSVWVHLCLLTRGEFLCCAAGLAMINSWSMTFDENNNSNNNRNNWTEWWGADQGSGHQSWITPTSLFPFWSCCCSCCDTVSNS